MRPAPTLAAALADERGRGLRASRRLLVRRVARPVSRRAPRSAASCSRSASLGLLIEMQTPARHRRAPRASPRSRCFFRNASLRGILERSRHRARDRRRDRHRARTARHPGARAVRGIRRDRRARDGDRARVSAPRSFYVAAQSIFNRDRLERRRVSSRSCVLFPQKRISRGGSGFRGVQGPRLRRERGTIARSSGVRVSQTSYLRPAGVASVDGKRVDVLDGRATSSPPVRPCASAGSREHASSCIPSR